MYTTYGAERIQRAPRQETREQSRRNCRKSNGVRSRLVSVVGSFNRTSLAEASSEDRLGPFRATRGDGGENNRYFVRFPRPCTVSVSGPAAAVHSYRARLDVRLSLAAWAHGNVLLMSGVRGERAAHASPSPVRPSPVS